MALIKCPECGKLINDELSSCNNCGYPFDGTEERVEANEVLADEVSISEKADEEIPNDTVELSNEVDETETVQDEIGQEENPVVDSVEKKMDENESARTESNEIPKTVQSDDRELNKSSNKKKKIAYIGVGIVILCLLVNNIHYVSKYKQYRSKYNKVQNRYSELRADFYILEQKLGEVENQNTELSEQISTLTAENDELKNGAKKQLNDVKNAYEKGDWSKVIELANTLHSKYNGSEEDKEGQKLATESQKKIDEANAAKEAEKAKGYETGITYDQLARTPGDFEGKKVKFTGKVIQVIEGDDSINIRLAVNDNYDTVLLGEYSKSIVSSRVLEDDHITIYGTSVGTISYKSTMGGTITIPGVYIEKIDQ